MAESTSAVGIACGEHPSNIHNTENINNQSVVPAAEPASASGGHIISSAVATTGTAAATGPLMASQVNPPQIKAYVVDFEEIEDNEDEDTVYHPREGEYDVSGQATAVESQQEQEEEDDNVLTAESDDEEEAIADLFRSDDDSDVQLALGSQPVDEDEDDEPVVVPAPPSSRVGGRKRGRGRPKGTDEERIVRLQSEVSWAESTLSTEHPDVISALQKTSLSWRIGLAELITKQTKLDTKRTVVGLRHRSKRVRRAFLG